LTLSSLEWKVLMEVCRSVRIPKGTLIRRLNISEPEASSTITHLSNEGFLKESEGWVSPTLAGRMVAQLSQPKKGERWIIAFTHGKRHLASTLKSKGFTELKAGVLFAPYTQKNYAEATATPGLTIAICKCNQLKEKWNKHTSQNTAKQLIEKAEKATQKAEKTLAERGNGKAAPDAWDNLHHALTLIKKATQTTTEPQLQQKIEAATTKLKNTKRDDRENIYKTLTTIKKVIQEARKTLVKTCST